MALIRVMQALYRDLKTLSVAHPVASASTQTDSMCGRFREWSAELFIELNPSEKEFERRSRPAIGLLETPTER